MKKLFSILFILTLAFTSCGDDVGQTDYDVIVIGAGGGGLGAAARLALHGKKVLVIEQHFKVGGYMTGFKRGDYTFDVSLHAIDGLDPEKGRHLCLYEKTGIKDMIKPLKSDPMYKVDFPKFKMAIPADHEKYRSMLQEKFPHEKEGLDDLFAALDRMDMAMNVITSFSEGEILSGLWGMITQPHALGTFFYYANSTMADFINDYIKDKILISAFTILGGFLGDEPGDAPGLLFGIMWNSYHKGGYYYLEGGSQTVANALAKVIKKNNGEILLSTRVTKIVVEDGLAKAVKTKDGKTFSARYIISNANATDTFFKLIGKELLPEDYVKDLEEMKIGNSIITAFLGVNKDYSKYFNAHEIMYSTSNDQNKNYEYIKNGNVDKIPFALVNYSKIDKTCAPKGKNVIVCSTIMPYDWNNNWRISEGKKEYNKLKTKVGKKFIERAEKFLPGLSKHIEVMEVGTPLTNERYTSNPKGSIVGWSNILEQSMMKRLPQETPIDNLYLAGAWTYPGGGQSAVIMSGIVAADKILDQLD